jgi:hypothetical protein
MGMEGLQRSLLCMVDRWNKMAIADATDSKMGGNIKGFSIDMQWSEVRDE